MDASKTIPKRKSDSGALDFDSLKTEGITTLQKMCGKTWTDYNLHDPGITILEQLCYALTELNYRAEFPMADFLAIKQGEIHFDNQALYQPKDIFPNQAITINDYRKLIIDQVPGIDNIWFKSERAPGSRSAGLYWAYVRLQEPLSKSAKYEPNWILQRIRQVYADNRNLCEDLQDIKIVTPQYYTLEGRIEVDGSQPPMVVLGEIYFRCARYIAQSVEFSPYDEMMEKGISLEELFTGPLTVHGYIDAEQLSRSKQTISIIDVIGLIGNIDGVKHVEQLNFVDEQGQEVNNLSVGELHESMPYLLCPASEDDIKLTLYKNGHIYPLIYRTLRFELDRLDAEFLAIRRSETDLEALSNLPVGRTQQMNAYFSIQQQFPDIYGINEYGVPASATRARKAQALQLKTYLLFFEQVLANSLEQLQQAAKLLSVDDKLTHSYFYHSLNNSGIRDLDNLYTLTQTERQSEIAKILEAQDNFEDRRSRILDYLLSLYGESFSQHTLRHLDEFAPGGDEHKELINNKLRLLKSLKELSGSRSKAFNYLSENQEANQTILIKKLGILLGLNHPFGENTTSAAHAQERILLLEHILLRPRNGIAFRVNVDNSFFAFRFSLILPAWTERSRDSKFRYLVEETVAINSPSHLQPYIHWLEQQNMSEFERLYTAWEEKIIDPETTPRVIDAASEDLVLFMQTQGMGGL